VDECVSLIIQFAKVTKDVIKIFAVYVHATLSNGGPVHTSIMETSTRWKIGKCDVINLLLRFSSKQKCNNSTKSKIRKEVLPSNTCYNIPCTLPLIAVIFGRCLTTSTNLLAILNGRNFLSMF